MGGLTRREFVKATGAAAAAMAGTGVLSRHAFAGTRASRLKVGVIGCGGRGTGAAVNALSASEDTVIWALGDVFADRLGGCRGQLAGMTERFGERGVLPDGRCFTGFDAYRQVIASGPDIVILATPPHFRPAHLAGAVDAGLHVFMEKPVAVDPAGVRSVLASGETAASKGLSIVAGTQRRHERCYLEAMRRVKDGAIGRIVSGRCYWNQGGLWVREQRPEWSDMEWQLRNWLYFTWLSGDHIVEQHVHNLDVINWALGAPPERATGMGGRQVRTDPAYGHIFDHFAIELEYPGGVSVTSMCRQIDGCAGRVEEVLVGTEGMCVTSSGRARIEGKNPWRFEGENPDPYTQEHVDLIAAIGSGRPLNEARNVAEATMTAVMSRMSAYTGKAVTWEQAMASKLDLTPPAYEFGAMPVPEVAVPGKTPLV